MSNAFDDMQTAINHAEYTLRAADNNAAAMARILAGRLRQVTKENTWMNRETLTALKKELTQFNASTGVWKS